MHSSSIAESSPAITELLDRVDALADRGLFIQAHELAAQLGDYRNWRGPRAMAMAARLVGHMGAPRLSDALAYLGYRRYPLAAETRLRYARFLMGRCGHYRAWRFLQQFETWLPDEVELRAQWLSFKAYLYASLRDFERSAELYVQAQTCGVDDPWLMVERSYGLEQEDRYTEALALCEQVLRAHPNYRSALVQAAQLQMQLGQEDTALEHLRRASQDMESAGVCAQLVDCLIEREHLEEALHWLGRMEQLRPLQEKARFDWLAARRCDISCLQGDYVRGLEMARKAGGAFYLALVEHLEIPQGQRRLLPVSFVRQHHMTCVPATLSALSAYWGKQVEHLEVAEEICYDGTSHQAERAWAERNGWLAVEFTADWRISRALIDRGVPFTLTVQYTGSGHLQALVGYDEPRGTLLIRDPGQAQYAECLAGQLFSAQQASGPRGMLLLPVEEAERLEGLELPDRVLWDTYYRVNSALEVHRREDALAAYQQLCALAPEHRLSWQAQRAVNWYDGREHKVVEATEALLQLYPGDANLILSKATSLAQLQPRQVQLDWLAGHCRARWSEPLVSVRYAELLSDDGRTSEQVQAMLERVLRQAPTQARAWNALASQRWGEGMREEACELYRLAACLYGTHEGYSNQYFRALRCLGRSEEGILFLQQRQARLGRLAAGPSITLSELLEELQRPHDAGALLEQAVRQRPQDVDLLLALADFYGRNGELGRSLELLRRAEPLSRRSVWLRAAVQHSQRSAGDMQQALVWSREAAELEPLSLPAHRLHVQLLNQVSGEAAVDAYVEVIAACHPHHCGIAELQVERAQRRSFVDAEQALRRLLDNHPLYAWAIRELAVCLARQGRRDEALVLCVQACQVDPQSSSGYSTQGFVLLQNGQRDAARECFREALRLSVDNDYASGALLDTSDSRQDAQQAQAFVHSELVRQVTFGDGWFAYQQQAQGLLTGEALLEQLTDALQHRLDLWQLWVVVARQHAQMEHYEQADTVLQGAIERFPLLPRLALEKAKLQKLQGKLEECCATLQESFRISPLWTPTVSLFVDCLLEQGQRLVEAEQLLRHVLARSPDNFELRAYLAYVLGEQEVYVYAADEAERVLRDEPSNGWAWNQLRRYSTALKEEQRPIELARELVQRRTGDSDAWLALAEHEIEVDAKENALREALRYNPRHRTANEQLLALLLDTERYDELRTLLNAPCWGGTLPVDLAVFGPRARHAEGLRDEAIGELRQLLALHPDTYAGWRDLADWYDAGGNYSAYVEAAQEMVRLEPKVAMAHGFLGHALLLSEKRDEALHAFSHAFVLDPSYLFAGLNAFDLQRDLVGDQAALEILGRLLQTFDEPPVWRRALLLGGAVQDHALKRRALTALANDSRSEEVWREVMADYPHHDEVVNEVLASGVASGSLHVAAVEYWLRRQDERWLPLSLWRGFEKALANDPQHVVKRAMLALVADRQNSSGLLTKVLHASRQAISEDGGVWGAASYAMVNHGRFAMACDWLSDWQRPDSPTWGLDNLALAMRILRLDDRAAAVSKLSLERDADNHDAMVWFGFDAALGHDIEALEVWLKRLQGVKLRVFFGVLQHLLQGYANAARSRDSAAARAEFQSAKALVRGIEHPTFKRLLHALSRRLAFGPYTPRWLSPLRYLQLRF